MLQAELIAYQFEVTYGVLKMQTESLTHDDSLLQLPFRGNCLNWVIGHILSSRNSVLKRLGAEPLYADGEMAIYGRGSDPITASNRESARLLEELLAELDRSQELILACLEKMTPADLEKEDEHGRPLAKSLTFSGFHESYHTGQTEYLRQLAGMDDVVIA